MISIAECRAVAAEKLELANLFPQRRHVLTASSDRWAGLAERLQAVDAATLTLYAAVMDTVAEIVVHYRGHDFSILRAGNPLAWKWSVNIEGLHERAGYSSGRESAISAATAAIDGVIASEQRVNASLENLGIEAVRDLISEIEIINTTMKH